jgi:adenine-specific DNA-methyltransferase
VPVIQFKGKSFVQNHHLAVPYHQLIPNKDKSLTEAVSLSDNLIIQGDNLLALKALLPTYAGKINCIYIDPPYNTGNEGWVYNDNVKSPVIKEWIGKIVGKEGEDFTRHDKWLCMMLPRIKILYELLTDDGVIFVSCDNNEQHNLRVLMDEVFLQSNCLGTIIWRNVTDNNPTNIAIEHEYIHVYAKNKSHVASIWKSSISDIKDLLINKSKELTSSYTDEAELQAQYSIWFRQNKSQLGALDRYKYIDKDGIYTGSQSVHNPGKEGYRYDVIHPVTGKPCKQPLMGYRFPEATLKQMLNDGKILFGENEDKIIEIKLYANEYADKLPSVITLDGRLGAYELREIFPNLTKAFDNPKPSQLIRQLLSFATKKNDIVLDSFAGSGTTAQAVLDLNKYDGGNRKFILVEMEDYADTITAERVRQVIKGVPTSKNEALKKGLGGSFSYFELGDPIETASLLNGSKMPSYKELARYVYYTATGEDFKDDKLEESKNYVGKSSLFSVYMYYKPDVEYLKTTALTLDEARKIRNENGDRPLLVFAPTKYVEQTELDNLKITFCQLPFEIYKVK